MLNIKINTYFRVIFFISLISTFSAFFIEYILGHQPCNLCLIQRIPYALSIILITLNYFFRKNEQFIIILLILIFTFSFMVSFYHFGIEQGYFQESAVCELKNTTNIISKEELLKQLKSKAISCKDVTFRIFGFSLSAINIVISLYLVLLSVNIFKNYEKYKK